MWVAVEATTLASAPLIYYHRDKASLSAAWKYLLVCSVGISLALLGNFFLAVSMPEGVEMTVGELVHHATTLDLSG
jgi:hydrogenase-4 component F